MRTSVQSNRNAGQESSKQRLKRQVQTFKCTVRLQPQIYTPVRHRIPKYKRGIVPVDLRLILNLNCKPCRPLQEQSERAHRVPLRTHSHGDRHQKPGWRECAPCFILGQELFRVLSLVLIAFTTTSLRWLVACNTLPFEHRSNTECLQNCCFTGKL